MPSESMPGMPSDSMPGMPSAMPGMETPPGMEVAGDMPPGGEQGADASEQGEQGEGGAQGSENEGEEAGGEQVAGNESGGDADGAADAGAQQGNEAMAGGGQPGGQQSGGQTQATAQGGFPATDGELGAQLDEQLMGSLEVFDGQMQGRRMVIATNMPAGGEEQGEGGGGQPGDGEGGPEDQVGAGGMVMADENGELPAGSGDQQDETVVAQGPSETGPLGRPGGLAGNQRTKDMGQRVPDDVGDGTDDDVVARQIREAAINEDDPVLREKLWEEYRNYKKSS